MKYIWFFIAFISLNSYGADASWTKATTHYTIYSNGGYATMPFDPPTTVPKNGGKITTVSYSVTPYTAKLKYKEAMQETIYMCYAYPYSKENDKFCQYLDKTEGSVNAFQNLNPYGSIWIKHTVTVDLSKIDNDKLSEIFPIFADGRTDTVTVNYQYQKK